MYYVYVIKLTNNQIYVGKTDNLKRRFQEHRNGKVRSTRKRVGGLIFYEAFINKEASARRERYLKTTKGKVTLRMMLRETLGT